MGISFIMVIGLAVMLIGALAVVIVVATATGRRPNLINCPGCGDGVSPPRRNVPALRPQDEMTCCFPFHRHAYCRPVSESDACIRRFFAMPCPATIFASGGG